MEFPYPLYDLTAMKEVANEATGFTDVVFVYRPDFAVWIDRIDTPVYAMIIPSERVPLGNLPSMLGMDYREALGCLSRYEGRISEPITHNGETLGNAGDWILLYGSPQG